MKKTSPAEGTVSLVYSVRLPLSSHTVNHVADLIRAHRKRIRSRWRKLDAGRIAVIALAHLRNDERLADLAGGAGVSASTVRRWVLEVIGLLAARSPRLDRALAKVAKDGGCVVLLDGTLIRTRRRTGRANRKNYSGKHKAHGLLFLALTDSKGRMLWISSARRGACSEITAARYDRLCARLRELGLGAVADLGFVGLDDESEQQPVVITGFKAGGGKRLSSPKKVVNRLISSLRAPVEHGCASLKTFRILAKVRMHPRHATALVRALLVLTHHQVAR
ncbi:transposase family protein [Streptomyces sp. UNOC14_S4]|uniref:transposase family protein n=1 Tax=Streptomyces sp. UNOC14_S4 TaxID=2872340 RepID=UPI001E58291B|nr:transposase family protein [Streptomyces sp. UNOC14_S4]MCC3769110.1 transposase [Streptomyces sp. UNOC14_S4]